MPRLLGAYQFDFVAAIQPATGTASNIAEYAYQLPAGVRPNRYASGPFCKFHLHGLPTAPGVYAIIVGDDPKYIGSCENLSDRFGANGYGYIAARNCHSDGQATNCKINSLVLASVKAGESIAVWFHACARPKTVEADVIARLHPPWNGRQKRATMPSDLTPNVGPQGAAAERFRRALQYEFARAAGLGLASISIRAGDLHRTVGGYPGKSHRMPVCCHAMKSMMGSGDTVLVSPPSGLGASLTIEYGLPRPA